MNKCECFLQFFDELAKHIERPYPEGVEEFYQFLCQQKDAYTEKPMFTESGLEILEYLQSSGLKTLKAKDIGNGMGLSSRKISGAIRKLCTDGYVEKYSQNPVLYSLSSKGKEFNIIEYKKTLDK